MLMTDLPPPDEHATPPMPPVNEALRPTVFAPPDPATQATAPADRAGKQRKRIVLWSVTSLFIAGFAALVVSRTGSQPLVTPATSVAAGRSSASPVVAAPAGAIAPALAPTGLDIHTLIERVSPSVLAIEISAQTRGGQVQPVAAGSGVVISSDGLVLTNAHVVDLTDARGQPLSGATLSATMADGTSRALTVLGTSPSNDIALLKLNDATALQPVELGDSDVLRVGDDVIAIGNSLDLGVTPTVTKGIISAKDRSLAVDANTTLSGLLQTDAAINHGNSGGALVNAAGQLIGVPSAGIPNAQNVGFAIAVNSIKPLLDQLKLGATATPVARVVLGVSLRATTSGVVVEGVSTGSGAEAAGISVGDVIETIDGKPVSTPTDIGTVLKAHKPGDSISINVTRAGTTVTVQATVNAA